MTSTVATVDRVSPCGTPSALRRHLAHGEEPCEACTTQPGAPSPVLCWQCGSGDRPAVAAYLAWQEAQILEQATRILQLETRLARQSAHIRAA